MLIFVIIVYQKNKKKTVILKIDKREDLNIWM